jgi:hypothetical protein
MKSIERVKYSYLLLHELHDLFVKNVLTANYNTSHSLRMASSSSQRA